MTPWFLACAFSEMEGPGEGTVLGGDMSSSGWDLVSQRHGEGVGRPRVGKKHGHEQLLKSSRVAPAPNSYTQSL